VPKYKLIVMTNPVEGRADEFNDWYTNVHIPDLLRLPGIVGAQRFSRAAFQRGDGPFPYEYLAIYHCDTNDLEGLIAEIDAKAGTADMPISDAMQVARFACYFEELTELAEAPENAVG
jgi:hypothetical protein